MTRIGALAAMLALLAAPAALSQAREPVESFVTAQYYHGLPPEQAARYGPEDVPRLLALLDERERESLELGYRERVNDTHLPHIASLPSVLPELFAAAAGRVEAMYRPSV
jgi:hypothetical protein